MFNKVFSQVVFMIGGDCYLASGSYTSNDETAGCILLKYVNDTLALTVDRIMSIESLL